MILRREALTKKSLPYAERITRSARDPQMGALSKKKPCPAKRGTTVFLSPSLSKASF
jgi:hypothetical protein